MAIHIFYTDFVGRAIMGGDPNAVAGSQDYARYDLGIRIGSQVMISYSSNFRIPLSRRENMKEMFVEAGVERLKKVKKC